VKKTSRVQIRVTGKDNEIDGYVEIILGVFAMSNVLVSHRLSKRPRQTGITQLYIDAELAHPPLGHMGTQDLPEYDGDEA